MNKSRLLRLVVVLGIALSSAAQSEPCVSATGRQVTVDGSASIAMRPDRVTFSVGVQTESASVAEAFTRNSAKVQAVIDALKARGVASQDLQTADVSVETREDIGKKQRGFQVTNNIRVTTGDPARVGELLQIAVAAGANQIHNLSFSVADPSKFLARGLELAFQNARDKATRLAALSGRTLGEVVCVSDKSSYGPFGSSARSFGYAANIAAVAVGEESLPFQVSVVFELK